MPYADDLLIFYISRTGLHSVVHQRNIYVIENDIVNGGETIIPIVLFFAKTPRADNTSFSLRHEFVCACVRACVRVRAFCLGGMHGHKKVSNTRSPEQRSGE
jgi:hypothetical protein